MRIVWQLHRLVCTRTRRGHRGACKRCTPVASRPLAGLSLLVGIILYLGAVTGEAGQNDHVGDDDIPDFAYSYGASFGAIVASFIAVEIAGVVSVYLFIIQYRRSACDRRFAPPRSVRTQTDLVSCLLRTGRSSTLRSISRHQSALSRQPSVLSSVSGIVCSGAGGASSSAANNYMMNTTPILPRDVTRLTALTTVGSAYSIASNGGDSSRMAAVPQHSADKYATTAV